jgi:hypothetical protein
VFHSCGGGIIHKAAGVAEAKMSAQEESKGAMCVRARAHALLTDARLGGHEDVAPRGARAVQRRRDALANLRLILWTYARERATTIVNDAGPQHAKQHAQHAHAGSHARAQHRGATRRGHARRTRRRSQCGGCRRQR